MLESWGLPPPRAVVANFFEVACTELSKNFKEILSFVHGNYEEQTKILELSLN